MSDYRPVLSKNSTYWISKYRYYELKYFCLQYGDYCDEYERYSGYISSSSIIKQNEKLIGNPTESIAERRSNAKHKIDLINDSASLASKEYFNYILESVTKGLSYKNIKPNCSKDAFYKLLRKFFWILDKKHISI